MGIASMGSYSRDSAPAASTGHGQRPGGINGRGDAWAGQV